MKKLPSLYFFHFDSPPWFGYGDRASTFAIYHADADQKKISLLTSSIKKIGY